jgi:hypothetical protein
VIFSREERGRRRRRRRAGGRRGKKIEGRRGFCIHGAACSELERLPGVALSRVLVHCMTIPHTTHHRHDQIPTQ